MAKRKPDPEADRADALVCLSCPLPFCTGSDKCFRSRKRELNHGRTTSEPRETVEEQSKTGTGGEQVEAVIDLDFSFDLPDFDGLLDDLDFNLPDDLPLNRERTEKK